MLWPTFQGAILIWATPSQFCIARLTLWKISQDWNSGSLETQHRQGSLQSSAERRTFSNMSIHGAMEGDEGGLLHIHGLFYCNSWIGPEFSTPHHLDASGLATSSFAAIWEACDMAPVMWAVIWLNIFWLITSSCWQFMLPGSPKLPKQLLQSKYSILDSGQIGHRYLLGMQILTLTHERKLELESLGWWTFDMFDSMRTWTNNDARTCAWSEVKLS